MQFREASSIQPTNGFAREIDGDVGPTTVEIQGESLYQKPRGTVMHKSQFQNSGPDLGLRSSQELATMVAQQAIFQVGEFSEASALSDWSCLRHGAS